MLKLSLLPSLLHSEAIIRKGVEKSVQQQEHHLRASSPCYILAPGIYLCIRACQTYRSPHLPVRTHLLLSTSYPDSPVRVMSPMLIEGITRTWCSSTLYQYLSSQNSTAAAIPPCLITSSSHQVLFVRKTRKNQKQNKRGNKPYTHYPQPPSCPPPSLRSPSRTSLSRAP